MNDVLVFGKNREKHDRRLETVMNIIETAGLKLNKDKVSVQAIRTEVPEPPVHRRRNRRRSRKSRCHPGHASTNNSTTVATS